MILCIINRESGVRTMRFKGAIGLGLVLLACSVTTRATTYAPVKITCPIGGEKFDSLAMMSNTTFGQRPDGRPYSPTPIPPIDECPGNGFVIFDDQLTKADKVALAPIVASPEYQALRASETPHYRAWWLMSRISRDPYALASSLIVASWGSDGDAARKSRYQSAFVDAAMALNRDDAHAGDWFWLRLRAANALRELGRFDAAAALIESLDQPALLPTDTDQRAGAAELIAGLRALVADRNTSAEPANLIPPRMAIERCKEPSLSPAETSACSGDAVRAEREEMEKWRRESGLDENDAAAVASTAASDAAAAALEAAAYASEAARQAATRKPKQKPRD